MGLVYISAEYQIDGISMRPRKKMDEFPRWWTYKKRVFGQLDLQAGIQDLTVEPYGNFKGALMDIRVARLIPVE